MGDAQRATLGISPSTSSRKLFAMQRACNRVKAREREQIAWELAAKGLTERAIGVKMGELGLGKVSQQGVHKMLKRVEALVLEESQEVVKRLKVRQTIALQHIYSQAMEGWEASKGRCRREDLETAAEKAGVGGDPGSNAPPGVGRDGAICSNGIANGSVHSNGKRKKLPALASTNEAPLTAADLTTLNVEPTDLALGDPKFLAEARAALAEIRKIWGANAPADHRIMGDINNPIPFKVYSDFDPDKV